MWITHKFHVSLTQQCLSTRQGLNDIDIVDGSYSQTNVWIIKLAQTNWAFVSGSCVINPAVTLMNQHRKACYLPTLHQHPLVASHTYFLMKRDFLFSVCFVSWQRRLEGRPKQAGVGQIVWGWCVCCVMQQYTASSVPGGVAAPELPCEKNRLSMLRFVRILIGLFLFCIVFKVSSNRVTD